LRENLITNMAARERNKAANTGSDSSKTVAPKTPAIAGPTIKPRLDEIAILPKFLLRLASEVTSAR